MKYNKDIKKTARIEIRITPEQKAILKVQKNKFAKDVRELIETKYRH
jgi:uncharacterized protein (DUF1778 family)